MTIPSDTRNPQRHHERMTDLTSPQRVLEQPTRRSTGAAPSLSEPERPIRRPGWVAALGAVAALAIVGAIALSGGDEVDQIEPSKPSPGLVTTTGSSASSGYWNPYTLEWVTMQTTSTTPTKDGYWNPYTLEWVPFED